jgi:hypothetical protein
MTRTRIDLSSLSHFCALEYRQKEISGPPEIQRVLLLIVCDRSGLVKIFVNQKWELIVQPKDQEYICELLDDFRERAELAPGTLLKHAASLSVGPLVTYAAGSGTDLKSYVRLLDFCRAFVSLL